MKYLPSAGTFDFAVTGAWFGEKKYDRLLSANQGIDYSPSAPKIKNEKITEVIADATYQAIDFDKFPSREEVPPKDEYNVSCSWKQGL